MSTFKLALRNLVRMPRRSVLTGLAVVAGVGVFILGDGFVSGLSENIIVAAIDGTVGHVQVRPKDYPTQPGQHPVDELVQLTPEARQLLDREAVAWTERLIFSPLAASGSDSLRVTAIGFDPERDVNVFPRELWKVQGALPKPDQPEVAVSPRVARLLKLEPGARLVLQVRTHQGAINALEVTVSGLMLTGNAAIDTLGILVPQRLARTLVSTDLPSHVAVKLRRRADSEPFAAKLRTVLGPAAEAVTWQQETAELLQLQEVRRRALDMVMFILMALAAFGIANTVLMAAHERIREIGTLRSMGMTEAGVLGLFLAEGSLIGLIGSLLGVLWGGALVTHWSRHPIDLGEALEKGSQGGISLSALLYARVDFGVMAASAAVGIAVAMVASLYPARVAARMVPAEAVRAE